MEKLGKLKKVELRKAWNHEAHDFTQWLAKEENLESLSEEIGIDIKLIQTEASVGKFNVDILAEEENTGRKIIIENQLESTNHDHLGKLITYSSGHDAEISIWIVKEVRDEHVRAIDWLNEHTDDDANFFLVKMELWQIGDSPAAPKFQIISKPNDWAKAIKESLSIGREPTETKLLQLEFWNKFKEFAKINDTKLKLRSARPQHWYSVAIGSSITYMAYTINTRENQIACEIYIPREKDLYQEFVKNKSEIEKKLNMNLEWMELPGKNASRIKITHSAKIKDSDNWESYFTWMQETGEKMQEVFSKYIKKFKSD
jgi:hypothetical protein